MEIEEEITYEVADKEHLGSIDQIWAIKNFMNLTNTHAYAYNI